MRRVLILLFLTPLFWSFLLQFNKVVSEWLNAPNYFGNRVNNIVSADKNDKLREFRWQSSRNDLGQITGRVFYNPIFFIFDEVFSFFTFMSPRIYFQSGDGSFLSPPGIEPIPFLFLPLSLMGMFIYIKKYNLKPLLVLALLALPAYIFGQKNFAYLFPVALFFIYFVAYFLYQIPIKSRRVIFSILFIYSFYLLGRVLWLLS